MWNVGEVKEKGGLQHTFGCLFVLLKVFKYRKRCHLGERYSFHYSFKSSMFENFHSRKLGGKSVP